MANQEDLTLVRRYDFDNRGRIRYMDFCDTLQNRANNIQDNQIVEPERKESLQVATESLLQRLQALKNVTDLQAKFKEIDFDNSGSISWIEFRALLQKEGVHDLDENEQSLLMLKFDKNSNGLIDYGELCDTIFHSHHVLENGRLVTKLYPKE